MVDYSFIPPSMPDGKELSVREASGTRSVKAAVATYWREANSCSGEGVHFLMRASEQAGVLEISGRGICSAVGIDKADGDGDD